MGRQFANDSMTPDPISVSRNQYQDEIPSDKPMHENTTPSHSNPQYTGRHYSDDFDGGFKKYGVSVSGDSKPSGQMVSGDKADRGRES